MNDDQFVRAVSSPERRIAEYRDIVIAYYDRVTEGYRERWGDSFHLPVSTEGGSHQDAILGIEHRVALAGEIGPDSLVLDVGCGIGGPTLNMAALTGARFVGVNIVPLQIAIARRRAVEHGLAERVVFEVGDGVDLAFADESFDAVTVFESGAHMPDKLTFYRECARVLRKGGRFVGIDWMAAAGLSGADTSRFIEPICRLHAIPSLLDVDTFREYAADAGLTLEALEDLAPRTGLTQLPPVDVPDWDSVLLEGLPPVQSLLSLGGLALADAARAGAFVLCFWSSRRR